MSDAAEAAGTPAKKSGGIVGTLINGVGIFVLTLVAVVAGGFVNVKLHPAPDYKIADGKATAVAPGASAGGGGKEEAVKVDSYFAIDPPLVVNFEDGSAVRFLQITAEIMAKDPKSTEGFKANLPLVRNNLLLIMGNREFASLMTREGKEKLRSEALAELRSIAKKESFPEPDDVLFTQFVVQ
jgi:flagellar FliL protein